MADHTRHDPETVAAAADRDGRLADVLATCADCLSLLGDLRALASATPGAAIPRRPRDFRLAIEQAARLRRQGWRRFLDALGTGRDVITRPLAVSLTTLGLVGVLLGSVPAGLPFASGAAADHVEIMQPMQATDAVDGRDPAGATGDTPAALDAAPATTTDGDALPILSLTFLGLGAATFGLRRAAAARRGVR